MANNINFPYVSFCHIRSENTCTFNCQSESYVINNSRHIDCYGICYLLRVVLFSNKNMKKILFIISYAIKRSFKN